MSIEKFEKDIIYFIFLHYGVECEEFDRKVLYDGGIYRVVMQSGIITTIYDTRNKIYLRGI